MIKMKKLASVMMLVASVVMLFTFVATPATACDGFGGAPLIGVSPFAAPQCSNQCQLNGAAFVAPYSVNSGLSNFVFQQPAPIVASPFVTSSPFFTAPQAVSLHVSHPRRAMVRHNVQTIVVPSHQALHSAHAPVHVQSFHAPRGVQTIVAQPGQRVDVRQRNGILGGQVTRIRVR